MDVRTFWSTADWAATIADMPSPGPLPCRTALVPREAVAHVLRRELIRSGRGTALAGTRFLPPSAAAAEVLREAEIRFQGGEESLRSARILTLFRSPLTLGHFPLDLLRSTPGWDGAFARTISDLEAAGLRPPDLETAGSSMNLRDVAVIWRAADASAGLSWTIQRIFAEAAAALATNPKLWIFPGPALACAGGDVTGAEARFLRAIPGVTLGLLAGRPLRQRYLDRMEALMGKEARDALMTPAISFLPATERDLLATYLFEPPAVLAEPDRPRSKEPDSTVDFEEHSGVEAELEATADWVARQIGFGISLEEIAVLVPGADPLMGLVVERLGRLPYEAGGFPVHASGGLPLTGTSAGSRALAVVRAIRRHLEPEALSEILPCLRLTDGDGRHLSHGEALTVAWSLGTAGGNPARPDGALEWAIRAVERQAELAARLATAATAAEKIEPHTRAGFEGLQENLAAIAPALIDLVEVSRASVEGVPLPELWSVLRQFFEAWLIQPGGGPRVETLLHERLSSLASDPACGSLAGDDALRVIEEAIGSVRLPLGRFGDPAVYVGPVRRAVGLSFRAVRIIGLTEGRLPSMPREDPVVPDSLRAELKGGPAGEAAWAPTAADRALQDLHAIDIVIRSAQDRIALSVPRTDLDRSQREPSSLFLEAAAALGRPDRATGKSGATIPDTAALERDGFEPAREAAAAFRRERPLGEAAWQDGVSRGELALPPGWLGVPSLDLSRIRSLRAPEDGGAMDGMLNIADLEMLIPGMTAEKPISASSLNMLLGCPHQFLFEKLLGFGKPGGASPLREIGQPYYGSLFHEAAERFFDQHGSAFSSRARSLADWKVDADAVADAVFVEFVKAYPLVGEAVRRLQRERLRHDLRELLDWDWKRPPTRRLIAAERDFGRPDPVQLKFGETTLFVYGRIDRIEVDGARTIVTDLKTGKPKHRSGGLAGPDAATDLQLALYGLAARNLASEWKLPRKVSGAYLYIGASAPAERAFETDFDEALEPAAQTWLSVAVGLLSDRIFPRTSIQKDCQYCDFQPVCGDAVYKRSGELLEGVEGSLGAFGVFKTGDADEEGD